MVLVCKFNFLKKAKPTYLYCGCALPQKAHVHTRDAIITCLYTRVRLKKKRKNKEKKNQCKFTCRSTMEIVMIIDCLRKFAESGLSGSQ